MRSNLVEFIGIIIILTSAIFAAGETTGQRRDAAAPAANGVLLAGASARCAPANLITVAKSGGDYDTVQAAVDAASTGTTILVYPGEYAEKVTINKPISLIGTDKNNCVIKKNVTGSGWGGDHLITIEAGIIRVVEISNLTAYNPRTLYAGTSLIIKSDAKIKNCNLVSDSWDTVIVGLSTVYFDDCHISGHSDTLSIMGYGKGTTVYVDNCRIEARSTSTSIWTGGGTSGGVVNVYLNDCDLLGESSNLTYGRIDVRLDTLIKLKYYITNTRCYRISDRVPFPLFFPSEYGGNMTAYIANCQFSTLGNSNVKVHYFKSSGADMNGDLSVFGSLASADSKFAVDSNGNITKIRNVATSFPSAQGAANTYLKNDGSGNLSWASVAAGNGSPKPANVLIVAKSGGDFDTVQAAVDAASTGTTILVYPGEYVEQVVVNKQVNIVGVNKYNCIIKYNITGSHVQTVVKITANNCHMENLWIENTYNSGTDGATALTVSRVNFRASNCIFKTGGRDTVWVVDDAYEPDGECLFENCYISGDYDIIAVVRSVIIRNCTIEKKQNGAYLWAQSSWLYPINIYSLGNIYISHGSVLAYLIGAEDPGKKITFYLSEIPTNNDTPTISGDGTLVPQYMNNVNFRGDLEIGKNLYIGKDLNIKNNLDVTGAISGSSVESENGAFTTSAVIGGDLTNSNALTLWGYDNNNCVWNTGEEFTLPKWTFGGDATLYRADANTLKTDGTFAASKINTDAVLWKDWAAAAGSGAFAYDIQSMAMSSTANGALQFFPIPYESGTVLTRLRVKWQAQGSGDGVKVRLLKRDESGAESAWSLVGAQQTYTDADAPHDITVSVYDFDDETMAANHSYTIEVESVVPSVGVKFYSIGVETNNRAY